MAIGFGTLVGAALLFGASARPSSCPATSSWRGWSSMKYSFIFGDSYTTNGFNVSLQQPSASNPLGNPPYPGYTSSNGPNWADYLTVKYNSSLLLTYDLAYGGATVLSSLVAPYQPTVLSLADQVEDLFITNYASAQSPAPAWTSSNAIFAIFIGINDVGNSYGKGLPATTVLNKDIFSVYEGLVQMLYAAGGRNFLFINVPPVDRSPLTVESGAAAQALEKADIAAFNTGISTLAKTLKKKNSDVNAFVVDSNALFTEVLDNPKSHPQTSLYKNTTAYCSDYHNGTPAPDTFIASCGIPVNQYFWLNSLHPTYPMQDVLAEKVASTLKAGPNVC